MTEPDPLAALTEQLDMIESAVRAMQDLYSSEPLQGAESLDLLDVAVRMNELKNSYEELRAIVNADVITNVGFTGEPVTIGDHTVEIKGSTPRKKWDNADLKKLVARRVQERSIDMDTGEMMLSDEEKIAAALEAAGISYWKVGELKKLGINADNYCETGDAKTSLIVRKK